MIDSAERMRFLREVLGKGILANDGVNASFRCPTCQHKDKLKLVVHLEKEFWHCWVCGSKGRSINSLLRKFSPAKSKEWQSRFLPPELKWSEQKEEKVKVTMPDSFIPLVNHSSDPDFVAVMRYVESRGVTERDIWRLRLGTCTRGRYRRRVVFLSFDEEGQLNYLTGRSIDSDSNARYINPKVERHGIVFNELDIDWDQALTICEGPFDLVNAGLNSTCLLGSTLTQGHRLFEKIVINKTPVILCMDSDAQKKQHNIAKLLYSHDIDVRTIELSGKKDIGEMTKDEVIQAKESSKPWNPESRLFYMIRNINSGSIL